MYIMSTLITSRNLELTIISEFTPKIPPYVCAPEQSYIPIADKTISGVIKKENNNIGIYIFITGDRDYNKRGKIDSLVLLNLDKKFRGKGYCTKIIDLIIKYSKNRGAEGIVFSDFAEHMDLERFKRGIKKRLRYVLSDMDGEHSLGLKFK